VGLYHSNLSVGERYDTWRRARAGAISVVVGPRSALFMPFPNLGLIVVDELHDDSYYQEESPPFYHAREAAVLYAGLANALCLMGSATPDVGSRYRADENAPLWEGRPPYRCLSLPSRILAHRQTVQSLVERLGLASRFQPFDGQAETIDLPPVRAVDMRQELKAGNRSIFSRALQAALARVLEGGQQAILFLNRRGTATYIFCRDCGHSLKCPQCDIPLTYHMESGSAQAGPEDQAAEQSPHSPPADPRLICHRCGYRRKLPKICPQCGGRNIRHFGTGTERVEAEVRALFPEARTQRWDYETTRQKGAHEIILSHFASRRTDVLIGTQMVAKGLDLPLVTLVGVVLADVGLNLPDYRAGERTFSLLTQVAGRAGRSPLGGQVILQTFDPGHYAIQAAARHDYAAFYQRELEYRRQMGYPPFSRLVRLEIRRYDPDQAEAEAVRLADQVRGWLEKEDRRATEMIGPAPCFYARTAGSYRWQIILRGPDPASLLRNRPLEGWQVEVDPVSLL
jgi:primosomal protein N' (replication factor Y)